MSAPAAGSRSLGYAVHSRSLKQKKRKQPKRAIPFSPCLFSVQVPILRQVLLIERQPRTVFAGEVVPSDLGDPRSIGEITYSSIFVLLYLTLIGSTAAYAAYQYALSTLPVGVVATYAYINPLIAALLGNLILKERLTSITCLAFILSITGVYLVNKGYNIKRTQRLLGLYH